MYKLTDMFVLILLIFAVFLSVAYTTLNKLFAVFFIYYLYSISIWNLYSFSLSISFTESNHFSKSSSFRYWNITV